MIHYSYATLSDRDEIMYLYSPVPIRKKRFALERSVALGALEALGRRVARHFSLLEGAQRIRRNPYVALAFEREVRRGINYPRRVSVRTLRLARCPLSTQSIRSDARFHKMSTVHAEYPFGR